MQAVGAADVQTGTVGWAVETGLWRRTPSHLKRSLIAYHSDLAQ
jgi:hypothetical protein